MNLTLSMNAKTYSTLQKTYDQSHLTCSTAIYYESQGNEAEALRCWRECLTQLRSHNTGGYRPRTETERLLLRSLKEMQDQCQDRVALLQTILVSRVEVENVNGQGWRGGNCRGVAGAPTLQSTDVAHSTISLIPPALPERPSVLNSSSSTSTSLQLTSCSSSHSLRPTHTHPHASSSIISRTPSPEKRVFLSTLRSARKSKKSEQSLQVDAAAAAKAASLAWGSISRTEGSTITHSLATQSVDPFSRKPNLTAFSDLSGSQWSSSSQPPSSSHKPQTRPGLSHLKPRPHSSILPLAYPTDSQLETEPPIPPPHRYASSETRIAQQNEQLSGSHPKFNQGFPVPPTTPQKRPPTPPPKGPPNIAIKSPMLLQSSLSEPRTMSASVPLKSLWNTQNSPKQCVSDDRPYIEQSLSLSDLDGCYRKWEDFDGNSTALCVKQDPPQDTQLEGKVRLERALETISRGVDMQAALQVANEIVVHGDEVHWEDVAGLDAAKLALKEAVVYPFLRPDLFSGLREPARGMLLFGPPGTGKTMLARAVATESKSTFFSISASSLTSKYLGESEKLVRALFALAKALAPSIIFVDEIDSLLSSRSGSGEHEATRRIKTEFLIQWSDLARAAAGKETNTGDASRVLVLAATNLPWAIDDAARRRFARRQYIPLPEGPTREKQLVRLLSQQKHHLSPEEMESLVELTEGFSGSDITALAKDAAMGPLRSLGEALLQMRKDEIRPISFTDFKASLSSIRPSVSKEGLRAFDDWAKQYGERV